MTSTDEASGTLAALVQCLEAEYRALLAEDLQELAAVMARKEQLLAQFAAQSLGHGGAQSNPGRELAQCRQALTRVRDLTQRNALVLAPRSAAVRARLRFLQAAVGRATVYAADGSIGSGRLRPSYPQSA